MEIGFCESLCAATCGVVEKNLQETKMDTNGVYNRCLPTVYRLKGAMSSFQKARSNTELGQKILFMFFAYLTFDKSSKLFIYVSMARLLNMCKHWILLHGA